MACSLLTRCQLKSSLSCRKIFQVLVSLPVSSQRVVKTRCYRDPIHRIRISMTNGKLIFNKTFIGKFKMKKALLAVLIPSLLGASSAFAGGIDLIKNDDITLNFNGDIDLKSYESIKMVILRHTN